MKYFIKNKRRIVEGTVVALCWFINVMQNYSLNFELGHLEGDILINSAISNVTGFFACFLSYPVLLYAKRKPAQILGFSLTMIASLIYIFVSGVAIKYFLLFFIKFGIALTFILIYCFTTELYPTQIRGLAFGMANTFGRLATLVASSIVTVD
jgi:OCT family organic cation transporter-like MFS transporter 4/5